MLLRMRPRLGFALPAVLVSLLVGACDGDDTGNDDHANPIGTTTAATGSGSDSTGASMTPDTGGEETPADATTASADSTDAGMPDTGASSTGPGNACEPAVPGEWNACRTEDGTIDNTLCNWTGLPGSTGFIGCLNAPKMAGNVCMIRDCEDDCDCFAAAPTGNADVVCAEILKGGGTACVLACSDAQTCPDTMECIGGTCYHPNAPQ